MINKTDSGNNGQGRTILHTFVAQYNYTRPLFAHYALLPLHSETLKRTEKAHIQNYIWKISFIFQTYNNLTKQKIN
jgi:hypothetical protein